MKSPLLVAVWPAERVGELVRRWNAGEPSAAIAAALGTTRNAIESKLAKLRRAGSPLTRKRRWRERREARAPRRCLHCGATFASEHIGNRICPTCLAEGPFTSAMV